jgi:hypothetical protein
MMENPKEHTRLEKRAKHPDPASSYANKRKLTIRHGGQVLFALLFLSLSSCYSVRLQTTTGVPMPDPNSERTDFYRNILVIEKDTVIRLGKLENEFTLLIKDCESGALHTVEYRSTFGGILLSAITFGKRRKVKIKYVCIKPSN